MNPSGRCGRPASARGEVTYDVSDRPYRSVYGLYDLELNASVHNFAGLPRGGGYHRDPCEHARTPVDDSGDDVEEVLDPARAAVEMPRRSPALIITTTLGVLRRLRS